MVKGNADCHIPNDKYREGWDRVFGKKTLPAYAPVTEHAKRVIQGRVFGDGLKESIEDAHDNAMANYLDSVISIPDYYEQTWICDFCGHTNCVVDLKNPPWKEFKQMCKKCDDGEKTFTRDEWIELCK